MSARYNIQKDDNVSIQHMEPNFICSDDSSYKFQLAMCSSDIQNKLLEFNNNCIKVTQVSVDEALIELTDLILSVAHSSLKKPKVTKTSHSKPKNKKNGLTKILGKTRQNLIRYARIYSKFPQGQFREKPLLQTLSRV